MKPRYFKLIFLSSKHLNSLLNLGDESVATEFCGLHFFNDRKEGWLYDH
jgi:hypothetical protein